MYKVGVLGAGTWGMAVARVLCNRHHSVMVWSALPQEIEYIQKNRTHPKLPELEIPDDMELEIEKLYFEEKNEKPIIHLKFKGKEEIVLNNPIELNNYLSSGTVKGMITFTLAQEVLKDGGCLIVDEVENHFNKEIVSTLIRFFMDGKINKNGGMLIFSTHYPELLDEYDRNDSIFITRNRDGITAENLSNILKRNDIKKSDAYQSGFLEGTTPTYEAYMQLKKSIAASLK